MGHLFDHVSFAFGEMAHSRSSHGGAAGEEALYYLGVDDRPAVGDDCDGPQQFVEVADTVLEKVGEPIGAVLEQLESVESVGVSGLTRTLMGG